MLAGEGGCWEYGLEVTSTGIHILASVFIGFVTLHRYLTSPSLITLTHKIGIKYVLGMIEEEPRAWYLAVNWLLQLLGFLYKLYQWIRELAAQSLLKVEHPWLYCIVGLSLPLSFPFHCFFQSFVYFLLPVFVKHLFKRNFFCSIVDLQCCANLCYTAKWLSDTHIFKIKHLLIIYLVPTTEQSNFFTKYFCGHSFCFYIFFILQSTFI